MEQNFTDLRLNNPFAYAELSQLKDGTYCFEQNQKPDTTNCRYYTTVDTDTFSSIAFEAYGDSKYWWIIYLANEIDNPFELELLGGTTLKIPDIRLL
jgi:nucleoid-associated protein YgaU